ncbi:hypothetical protein HPP92_008045 [Vanilla planifolia]|uniref:Uncharacterized protein n=1 Tax=Vanilla planifolia TaxID=51239 RepID=A0A835V6G6_VANPL|nr:hypothetical protein HPP92_008045 [Vanilla planifolia]
MVSSNCIDESSTISTDLSLSSAPKRQRVENTEAGAEVESRGKLPSSQYKGVVPQPNGRWGAQIYEKHQRVWLGTFNHERDAARAYDVAAQRFRGRDAATNFPPLFADPDASQELAFVFSCSKAEVVDMLRKHTYLEELQQSYRRFQQLSSSVAVCYNEKPLREHLFDKAVTPSDVGKLNRLVIPKQHAEKHFPLPSAQEEESVAGCPKGMLLNFHDADGKVWRFRYSYWNSSQSYVLTKGWSRFVKEKGLKVGDTVRFYRSKAAESHLYIECRPFVSCGGPQKEFARMVRLFGVNIAKAPASTATLTGNLNDNGKRTLEKSDDLWFKQCVLGS